MKNFLTKVYTLWCAVGFFIPLLVFMPFFWVLPSKGRGYRSVSYLHHLWAKISVFSWGTPYKIEYRFEIEPERPYIYCSNHTSYIDIVMMGLLAKGSFVFLGKEELARVPVFGYVFKKYHILVNRDNHVNAYQAMLKASEAIDDGKSVIMFPEGGIRTNKPPQMASFKDGAFRIAIEKQVPIIPVSFLYHWKIFPKASTRAYYHPGKAIVHPPIETKGMKMEDLENLKQAVYEVIRSELASLQIQKDKSEQQIRPSWKRSILNYYNK